MLDKSRFQQVERLFLAALERPNDERLSWLGSQAADAEIIAEVRAMVQVDAGGPTRRLRDSVEHAVEHGFIPERIGAFLPLRKIGEGGMGIVYAAYEPALERTVALKVVRPELMSHPETQERFRREAHAAAALAHDNIVPIYAFGEADGFLYFAMPWIDGRSLDDVLQSLRSEPPAMLNGSVLGRFVDAELTPSALSGSWADACARIAVGVADALAHAHDRGLVHRDVKPSNVMLTRDGRALLLDFGVALRQDVGSELTGTGAQPGSFAYMAPEQLDGTPATPEVDVHALGTTLYELLSLQPPFRGRTQAELIERIQNDEPPRLRDQPRDLWRITCMALAKDPRHRYRNGGEFAVDLRRFLERLPVRARAVGPLGRLHRWARRRPARAALGLVACLFVLTLCVLAYRWPEMQAAAAADRDERFRLTVEAGHLALDERSTDGGSTATGNVDTAAAAFGEARSMRAASPEAIAGIALTEVQTVSLEGANAGIDTAILRSAPELAWWKAHLLRRLGRPEEAARLERDAPTESALARYLQARPWRDAVEAGNEEARECVIELLDVTRLQNPPAAHYLFELARAHGASQPYERVEERAGLARLLRDRWGAQSAGARYWSAFVRSPRDPGKLAACEAAWPRSAELLLTAQIEASDFDAAAATLARAQRQQLACAPWLEARLVAARGGVASARSLLASLPEARSDTHRACAASLALAAQDSNVVVNGIDAQCANPQLLLLRSRALLLLQDPAAAAATTRRALDIDPRSVRAWHQLAQACRGASDHEAEKDALQQALRLDGDPDCHLQLGLVLLEGRTPLQAEAHFAAVVAKRPDDVRARMLYGKALFVRGASPDAIDQLQRALKLDPGCDEARIELARAFAARRDDQQARAAIAPLDDALLDTRLATQLAWALRELGSKDDLDRCEQICKARIAQNDDMHAHRLLGWVQYQRDRHDEGLQSLRHGIARAPHAADAKLLHVDLAQMLGDIATTRSKDGAPIAELLREAERSIGMALSFGEPTQQALIVHADLFLLRGDRKRAEQVLTIGMQQDPRRFRLPCRLGELRLEDNRVDAALVAFEQALAARPRFPEARFLAACCRARLGEFDAARRTFDAIAQSPGEYAHLVDTVFEQISSAYDAERHRLAAMLLRVFECLEPEEFADYRIEAAISAAGAVGEAQGRPDDQRAWRVRGLGWLEIWYDALRQDGVSDAECDEIRKWLPSLQWLRVDPELAPANARQSELWRNLDNAAKR